MLLARVFIVSCFLALSFAQAQTRNCVGLFRVGAVPSAFNKFEQIIKGNREATLLKSNKELVERAYGTDVPIVHSFEAEGSDFANIRRWFSEIRPSFKNKIRERFEKEINNPETKPILINWLSQLKLRSDRLIDDMIDWGAMTLKERFDYFLSVENPLQLLTSSQADFLFESRLVTFDDITVNKKAPHGITVGDDLGSWEVRSDGGQVNRAAFMALRAQVEKFLDQKIGHQHLFHAWPKDNLVRQEMAPHYIEIMDAATWYLYWRQMKRTDTDLSGRTVVDHPYLGVYSTNSLAELIDVVSLNRAEAFHDKYRLVGARNFPASPDIPAQTGFVPDWEIRSGNKGVMREFVEAALESRLVTGDYQGIKAFGSYQFDTNASLHSLTRSYLSRGEVSVLERFEESFPMLTWGKAANAKNNYRTKIIAPLLPWENRFDLSYKWEKYKEAQALYARSLVDIGRDYLRVVQNAESTRAQKLEERKRALTRIKRALRKFAGTVRLDLDGELYLKPRPVSFQIPSINVNLTGPIDANRVDLGIEYSVRLPDNMKFQSVEEAHTGILGFAKAFASRTNFESPVLYGNDGHGHGISVKYTVKDPQQNEWRFEWDGIQRKYNEAGEIIQAYDGHIEIVTPKFSPQSIQGPIATLYQEGRARGLLPRRNAGGAHGNFDLSFLKKYPVEVGTRAVLNLISYFESNQEVILFLWQHPKRIHAAHPVVRAPEMAEKIKNFNGDWNDLGRLLYEIRYFNTYVNRKPKYVPLNLTSLMTPILPEIYYERTLDIKNSLQAWFPNFNKVYGRGEARFFDAPTDEVMAALHIKYLRALLNKSFNSSEPLELKPRFNAKHIERWKKNPKLWKQDAENHLKELGLDPQEFQSLIWDSYMNRVTSESRKVDYQIYQDYLPAKSL